MPPGGIGAGREQANDGCARLGAVVRFPHPLSQGVTIGAPSQSHARSRFISPAFSIARSRPPAFSKHPISILKSEREMPQVHIPELTPAQETVIAALAGGATMKVAAEAASLHRNTISYWRRTSLRFRDALYQAQYDKAVLVREEAENHVAEAFAAIHTILTKPDASDTARLNAAKYIIDKASTPPPPQAEVTYKIEHVSAEYAPDHAPCPAPGAAPQATAATAPKPEIVHSNAQSPVPSQPAQTVRAAPKVGRNEPCPCGSHLKFKRCCLGKANVAAAA